MSAVPLRVTAGVVVWLVACGFGCAALFQVFFASPVVAQHYLAISIVVMLVGAVILLAGSP